MQKGKIRYLWSTRKNIKFAKIISNISKKEKNLWYRTREQIEESITSGKVLLALKKEKLIGYIIIQPLSSKWVRLNSIYVNPKYRGKRIFNYLLNKTLRRYKKKNIFISVFEKKIISFINKKKFRKVNLDKLPFYALFSMIKEGFVFSTIFSNANILLNRKFKNFAYRYNK